MRHKHGYRKLNRTSSHRKALLKNLAIALIQAEKIETTIAKAKTLRSYIEKLITKAKVGDFNSHRIIFKELQDKEATKKIKQYTPETFSKEKKLVNAIVITMALMTMADKKIETEEVTKVMDLIKDIEEIQELNMVQEAIELYQFHLEDLEKVINNEAKYLLKVEHKLMDIAKIKTYEGYPNMIKVLLDYIAEADGHLDKSETEMKNKILGVLK